MNIWILGEEYTIKQELNNIISYRNIMQEKRKYTNDFLQKIIDDSGKLNKLLNFVKQEDNQQNLNETMGQLSKEFDSIKRDRETAYASFEGFSGLKN